MPTMVEVRRTNPGIREVNELQTVSSEERDVSGVQFCGSVGEKIC